MSRFTRQLTYWEPPGVPQEVPPAAVPRSRDPLQGWSLDKVDNAARYSLARLHGWIGRDTTDAYDAAWHAICELILTASEPPSWGDLVIAGMDAARGEAREEMRQHGYRDYGSTSQHGPGSMPAWVRYWHSSAHCPSPEDLTVDKVAVAQIWPRLTPRQRQALEALAAFGDHQAAAEAMGITVATFGVLVAQGRRRFAALWHEGTEPPKRLLRGRMGAPSTRELRPCGSEAAFFRHYRKREHCDICWPAQAARRAARKAAA